MRPAASRSGGAHRVTSCVLDKRFQSHRGDLAHSGQAGASAWAAALRRASVARRAARRVSMSYLATARMNGAASAKACAARPPSVCAVLTWFTPAATSWTNGCALAT